MPVVAFILCKYVTLHWYPSGVMGLRAPPTNHSIFYRFYVTSAVIRTSGGNINNGDEQCVILTVTDEKAAHKLQNDAKINLSSLNNR